MTGSNCFSIRSPLLRYRRITKPTISPKMPPPMLANSPKNNFPMKEKRNNTHKGNRYNMTVPSRSCLDFILKMTDSPSFKSRVFFTRKLYEESELEIVLAPQEELAEQLEQAETLLALR